MSTIVPIRHRLSRFSPLVRGAALVALVLVAGVYAASYLVRVPVRPTRHGVHAEAQLGRCPSWSLALCAYDARVSMPAMHDPPWRGAGHGPSPHAGAPSPHGDVSEDTAWRATRIELPRRPAGRWRVHDLRRRDHPLASGVDLFIDAVDGSSGLRRCVLARAHAPANAVASPPDPPLVARPGATPQHAPTPRPPAAGVRVCVHARPTLDGPRVDVHVAGVDATVGDLLALLALVGNVPAIASHARVDLDAALGFEPAHARWHAGPRAARLRVAPPQGPAVADAESLARRLRAGVRRRCAPRCTDGSPAALVAMVVLREDPLLPYHDGIDAQSLVHAVGRALAAGHWGPGASTLPMQTVKMGLLDERRTLARKADQIALTLRLAAHLTPDAWAALYLDAARFGPDLFGAENAAHHWFGRSLDALSLWELAFLAALIPRPLAYAASMETSVPPAFAREVDRTLQRVASARPRAAAAVHGWLDGRVRRGIKSMERRLVAARHDGRGPAVRLASAADRATLRPGDEGLPTTHDTGETRWESRSSTSIAR